MPQNSYTFKLTKSQQIKALEELSKDRYVVKHVPYTQIAVKSGTCSINLYTSGKLLIQGKTAQDWISFTLEPEIVGEVVTGYDEVLNPDWHTPHLGVDESGKGDYLGPLIVAAVFVDTHHIDALQELGVRDSKRITSDAKAIRIADGIRKIVGDRNIALLTLKPQTYNPLYLKIKNLNRLLAWGHARVIEELLTKVPECTRGVIDQFGPEYLVKKALMTRGKKIDLEQRTKAEDDPAVAAASIIARAEFVRAMQKASSYFAFDIPKGVSAQVKDAAVRIVKEHGPDMLPKSAKLHFKTTTEILSRSGYTYADINWPEPKVEE
ncbi:MAG: ribonuclease HIII [Kiritimatiellia bacterium]|jgi:ribonuclease HIII